MTQARAELSDLVNRFANGGERVVLSRHGRAVAAIVSAADRDRLAALDEQTVVDRPALLVLGSRADSGHPTAAPQAPGLAPIYDAYSFGVLPALGKVIANDSASYRYLAESIRMFPDQETLAAMMREAGFDAVKYHNLTGGIVALHRGWRY